MGKEEGYASDWKKGKTRSMLFSSRRGKRRGIFQDENGEKEGVCCFRPEGEKGGEWFMTNGEKEGAYCFRPKGKKDGEKRGIALFRSTILNHAVPLKD